jgi:hypothetical protein
MSLPLSTSCFQAGLVVISSSVSAPAFLSDLVADIKTLCFILFTPLLNVALTLSPLCIGMEESFSSEALPSLTAASRTGSFAILDLDAASRTESFLGTEDGRYKVDLRRKSANARRKPNKQLMLENMKNYDFWHPTDEYVEVSEEEEEDVAHQAKVIALQQQQPQPRGFAVSYWLDIWSL